MGKLVLVGTDPVFRKAREINGRLTLIIDSDTTEKLAASGMWL